MSQKKYTLQGAAWSSIADITIPLTGLLTTIFLSRFFGPKEYGYWFLLVTIIYLSERLIAVFLAPPTAKMIERKSSQSDFSGTIFTLYFGAGIIIAITIFFAAPHFALFFHSPRLAEHLPLFAFEIPIFALANSHLAIITGKGIFEKRALLIFSRWTSRMIFIILFVYLGFGIKGAMLGSFCSLLLQFIIGRYFIQPPLKASRRFPWKLFLHLAAPFFFHTILLDIMLKLDIILLKHFGTQAADIGNYAAAQNLAYAPTFFTASITILLIASLSKFEHDGRTEKTGAVAEKTFKIIAWLFPICALIAGSRVEVISFIFGPGYEQAAEIIGILVFGSIPLLIIQTSSGIFMAKSKPSLAALLIFPAPLIYLVVGLVCRNYFSLKGAAIFMVLSLAAAALINMFVIHQKWHIRYSPKSLIINILIAVCVFIAGNLIQANGIYLIAELIITAVFVILALSVTGEIPREILTSLKRKE